MKYLVKVSRDDLDFEERRFEALEKDIRHMVKINETMTGFVK